MSGHTLRVLEGAEFRAAWLVERLETRLRIAEEVKAGRPMEDPEKAALAAGHAIATRVQQTRVGYWMIGLGIPVVIGLLTGPWPGWSVMLGGGWIIVNAVVQLRSRHHYEAVEQANREVIAAYLATVRPPPPAEGSIRDAARLWGRRMRGTLE